MSRNKYNISDVYQGLTRGSRNPNCSSTSYKHVDIIYSLTFDFYQKKGPKQRWIFIHSGQKKVIIKTESITSVSHQLKSWVLEESQNYQLANIYALILSYLILSYLSHDLIIKTADLNPQTRNKHTTYRVSHFSLSKVQALFFRVYLTYI